MSFSLSDFTKWTDFIGLFDDAYDRFIQARDGLLNQSTVPPELEDEYNSALAQANADLSEWQYWKGVRDDVENFFADYGQQIMDNPNILGLQGLHYKKLGFIPQLLAAGAAIAAIYILAERIAEYLNMSQKIAYAESHSVTEANQLFGSPSSGLLGSISGAFMPFAVIAALVILGPPVLKMLEGRK